MKFPEELQFIPNSMMAQKSTAARLDGKVCVITGATSGIGYEAAKRIASGGAEIVMVCRNRDKGQRIQSELFQTYHARCEVIIADFTKLADVRRAAEEIAGRYPVVNILVNNAGIFNKRRRITINGNEEVFQVIHLASFLLTRLLVDNLKAGAPARILEVNSEAHRFGGLNSQDLDWRKRPYIGLRGYGAAKTAQLLSAWILADQLKDSGVTINAMHPGAVRTNIGMNNGLLYRLYNHYILRWFLKDPSISANALYYLAAAPELEHVSGKFFNQTIEEKPAPNALDKEMGKMIWKKSGQLTNLKGD